MKTFDIKTEITKEEWDGALLSLDAQSNIFLDWNRLESSKKYGGDIIRTIVYKNTDTNSYNNRGEVECVYGAEVEIRKYVLIKLFNVRCGGREEGNGIFFRESINDVGRDEIIAGILKKVKLAMGAKYGMPILLYLSFYFEKESTIFSSGWHARTVLSPIIDLSPPVEDIEKSLDKKTRNEIRQAKKRGAVVKIMNNEEGLKALYDLSTVYFLKMKRYRWLNNQKLFMDYYLENVNNGLVSIFLAEVKDKKVAFAVMWHKGKKIIYGDGGLDREYQWYRPSNLLLWHIITWAKNKGYTTFDMGGANMNKKSETYSISRFKLGFGSKLNKVYNYYRFSIC